MNFEVIYGDPVIVHGEGEIDYSNAEEFRAALNEAVRESPGGFVIDLFDASFIDSPGIQAIFDVYRKVFNAGGHLAVVVVHPNAKKIFHVLSVDIFPNLFLCDNIEEAVRSLSISAAPGAEGADQGATDGQK
jgi:anti-anti-sigma factor